MTCFSVRQRALIAGRAILMGVAMTCSLTARSYGSPLAACAFGQSGDAAVNIYTLRNQPGIEAKIMSYGASIVSLKTPDRHGHLQNIVLGFDSLEPYLAGVPYYGATVGRYANRIAKAGFELNGRNYSLAANDGPNNLHGGARGFDKRVWKLEGHPTRNAVNLMYVSEDGEEGFPGQVTVHVTYRLGDDNSLTIEYRATTTADTPLNLANHAYFNLTGDPSRTILGHTLKINAERFTPVDATLIPTGELRPVAKSPFDFRTATPIGSRIDSDDEQLKRGRGYDHNWVLNQVPGKATVHLAAVLTDPDSGRAMEIFTTQPGLQFYSGNFMNGKPAGEGSVFGYRTGVVLETQHFPDSPNQRKFPDSILRAGHTYSERTVLHFQTFQ